MNVVLNVSVNLLFDLSTIDNETEWKVAKILHNHLKMDVDDENPAFCYARSEDMVDDILKEDIDDRAYNRCIEKFEERGWLHDYGDGVYEFISSEETRMMDRTGKHSCFLLEECEPCDTTSPTKK